MTDFVEIEAQRAEWRYADGSTAIVIFVQADGIYIADEYRPIWGGWQKVEERPEPEDNRRSRENSDGS